MTHVLGLDLSLTAAGWATVDSDGSHECGVIRTTATAPLGHRLDTIVSLITNRLNEQTHLAVVEQPFNAAFGIEPAKVFGAVILALYHFDVPVAVVPPASLKVFACAAGGNKGNAKLGPTVEAVKRLDYEGADDNEVDALWLATLGWHLLARPVVDLPQTHTRALAAPWAKPWPGFVPSAPKTRKKKAAA